MTHVDDIRQTLSHAKSCYDAWWLLECHHQNRSQIVRVCNQYFDYFGMVQPALYTTVIVKLASVFGGRKDEITLKNIPGAEYDLSFGPLWMRGRQWHKYRSKTVAHRALEIIHRNFVVESGCPRHDDVEALLKDACDFFNTAGARLNVQGIDCFNPAGDLLSLILDFDRFQQASFLQPEIR